MRCFCYDENEKTIRITDGTTVVIWKGVEQDTVKEAAQLYWNGESPSSFLMKKGCERSRGNKPE